MANRTYLILDAQRNALANAELLTAPDVTPMRLSIMDDKADDVMKNEMIILFSSSSHEIPLQCRVLRQRGDVVLVEKMAALDPEVRRNLRVPVQFKSYIYPLPGCWWRGRVPIESVDLSCGGIAFYSDAALELNEQVEIVVTPHGGAGDPPLRNSAEDREGGRPRHVRHQVCGHVRG